MTTSAQVEYGLNQDIAEQNAKGWSLVNAQWVDDGSPTGNTLMWWRKDA